MNARAQRTESTAARTRARAGANERARVLIVDDDENNLLALKTVIEEIADVVVANSGEAALRHLLKGEFAVILLDVFMPGIDGYETAQLIRQREQSKGIPIIFLSAVNKEESHLIRGYSMGAVDYVFKPVDAVVLRSKVCVFVELYEKTQEIRRKAAQEQRLLDENLRISGERLAAEQALRRSEERQALILQSLPIVLYLEPLDASPRVPQYISGDFEALTGFRFDELKRTPDLWAERLHPDDRHRVAAARAATPQTGSLALEYRWQCADGRYKHFLEQAVALRSAHGSPTEIAGTLLDVTDRRQLEDQLLQAQKMDAVGKLTGGIAHDFNNLLAAVLGGLGLLERRCELGDEGNKIVGMARHAAEQGSDLVKRLLAFARRQQLEPAPVPIDRLAESMKGLMTHTLGGLVQVEWRLDDGVWPALADENQLELALMNLILNARDAMPEGGVISVSVTNRTIGSGEVPGLASSEYVVFEVADSGGGIAPELLDRVFEPFFTTKDVGKGTGLGLSMVYGFAQQSGGMIRVAKSSAEGTSFELLLPRAEVIAGETPTKPDRALAAGDAESGRPLRILLVDDHEGVRAATAALLEELGHEVADAAGPDEGLAMLANGSAPFDLIVTDYAMPSKSGTEVIRLSRDISPALPAIIVTGYADADMISNRPDDVVVLIKPFRNDQLVSAIAAVTRSSSSALRGAT